MDKQTYPSFEEAKKQVLKQIKPTNTIYISIKKALGNIISQDIIASENLPPFNNSAVDGYAVKIKNIEGASPKNPILIDTFDDVPAGKLPATRLKTGTTVKVMTGAPVPEGTDAVIPLELTETTYGNRIKIIGTVDELANIRFVGEDVQKGEVIIPAGTEVGFGNISMLAAMGLTEIPVYRRPKLGILASGDELIPVDKPLQPGKIRNSNTFMLMALAQSVNADIVNLGVAKDSISDITNRIKKGEETDIIVCTGGANTGDRDFIRKSFEELNVDVKFTSVNHEPGPGMIFGIWEGRPIFALPGNPVATYVCFIEYVVPAIKQMLEYENPNYNMVPAILESDLKAEKGLTHFVRGVYHIDSKGIYHVDKTGNQATGMMSSISNANCIIVVPDDVESLKTGETVLIHTLNLMDC